MQEVLFFTHFHPMPTGVGVAMRAFAHVKAISENYRLHLVTTQRPDAVPNETRQLCEQITFHSQRRFDIDSDQWLDHDKIGQQIFIAFRLITAEQIDAELNRLNVLPFMRVVDFDDIESIALRRRFFANLRKQLSF